MFTAEVYQIPRERFSVAWGVLRRICEMAQEKEEELRQRAPPERLNGNYSADLSSTFASPIAFSFLEMSRRSLEISAFLMM
jgi:hypothetical protein